MGEFFGGIGHLFSIVFMHPIYNGLMLLFQLFGDFGLAIVVLTLIIKLLLFPLTLKQLKSMKANQQLQPRMQEIRRKYAKDQQAQMRELQALYAETGFNPMSGCLPLLIQLPVLYGLYNALYFVLQASNENSVPKLNSLLYPFVPHFSQFPDLSFTWLAWLQPLIPMIDWTYSLAHTDPTYVLPVLAALATFVQLRMSQPRKVEETKKDSKKAEAPDPTAQTMKTMQFIMPLFTLFVGWTLPAGLSLYWLISTVFQAAQQYFVTGWGALAVTPISNSSSQKSANVDSSKKNTTDNEDEKPLNDAISRQLNVATSAAGSSNVRRTNNRSGSASARRRSGSQRKR